jgi:DNA-directed RNA polymerase specialized sigma24 family protein
MKKIHKVNAAKTRLSDEEVDPIEQDDLDTHPELLLDGWVPWDPEDILDIKKLIEQRLPTKQRDILEAFLEGRTHKEIGVTEKYWRWHFAKGIEFIKKELKV